MDDQLSAALGITAVVTAVQEFAPATQHVEVYKVLRAGLALGAPFLIDRRRPWQRAVVTGLGIWGAAELLQLGYSALMMSADTLLIKINDRRRGRR